MSIRTGAEPQWWRLVTNILIRCRALKRSEGNKVRIQSEFGREHEMEELLPYGLASRSSDGESLMLNPNGDLSRRRLLPFSSREQEPPLEADEVALWAKSGAQLQLDKNGNSATLGKQITLNGDQFGGLVKIEQLRQELDKHVQLWNALLQALQSPATEPGNGAPSVFQTMLLAALTGKMPGQFGGNIENEAVQHGSTQPQPVAKRTKASSLASNPAAAGGSALLTSGQAENSAGQQANQPSSKPPSKEKEHPPCKAREYYSAKWDWDDDKNENKPAFKPPFKPPPVQAEVFSLKGVTLCIRGHQSDNPAVNLAAMLLKNGRFDNVEQSKEIWRANTDPCLWVEVDASLLQLNVKPNQAVKGEKISHPYRLEELENEDLDYAVLEFNLLDSYNDAIVHGGVSAKYLAATPSHKEGLRIDPEEYDFDMHKNAPIRNAETLAGKIYHGSGTAFWIVFKGRAKLHHSQWAAGQSPEERK